ncbi:hypothetical protein Y032_0047g1497 [Ancylostoma ceylanicum]|nr:hypothetical protein Y032_0047g1497 [Ancylostoma ceylanicum]
MNNAFDRRERTVFVSMIHRSVTDDDLYEIMSQAGPIEKIIFKENADGTLLHALVIFRNIESVIFSMFHLQPVAKGPKLIQIRPLRSIYDYTKKQAIKLNENVASIGSQLEGSSRLVAQCQWSRCHGKCTAETNRLYSLLAQNVHKCESSHRNSPWSCSQPNLEHPQSYDSYSHKITSAAYSADRTDGSWKVGNAECGEMLSHSDPSEDVRSRRGVAVTESVFFCSSFVSSHNNVACSPTGSIQTERSPRYSFAVRPPPNTSYAPVHQVACSHKSDCSKICCAET